MDAVRILTAALASLALVACEAQLTAGDADGDRPGARGPDGRPGGEVFIPGGGESPDDPARPGDDPAAPGRDLPPFEPAPPTLHRLTRGQYVATLHDLLGADVQVPDDLEADTPLHGFTTIGGGELTISPRAAEQFEAAALAVAAQVFEHPDRRVAFVGCAPGSVEEPCARDFLARFARRAWRRPAAAAELDALTGLARDVADRFRDPWKGLEYTVAAMLQSPWFLFRVEQGEPDPAQSGRLRYTSWEMAARLAYFLWGGPPDDALLDAAARDELVTEQGLVAQIDRMLASPRAREALAGFFIEYLNLDRLDTMAKDAAVFPQMSPDLVRAMRQEVLAVIDELVFARDADFRDLLDTRTTFVDQSLAALYGIPPPAGPGFQAVELPAGGPRGGLLGMAAILALNAHATVTSPTLRGRFIQANLRCFDIPPPPPGIPTLDEIAGQGPLTVRQKLEAHRADPTCNGCHQYMDPMGYGLEHFDALGAYRTTDNGQPVDARSELDGVPFEGARELGTLLRDDPAVTDCLARRLYRYGTGHLEAHGEERAIVALAESFAASGYRVQALVEALVLSDGFRYAAPAAEGDE